jgi:hypothetical protein
MMGAITLIAQIGVLAGMDVILDVLDRAEASLCRITHVRIDAGFPSGALLAGL